MGNKLCHNYGNKVPNLINKILNSLYNDKKTVEDEDISNLISYLESNFSKLKRVGEFTNS